MATHASEAARAARLIVWRRNAPQLFFSFVAAGLTNVAAQEFFARAVPGSKERWLASTLLAGTLAAMAGIGLGRRWAPGGPRSRAALVLASGALAAALGALASPLLYVAGHAAVRGLLNLGVQGFDEQAAALASDEQRRANDHASTALRFVGMLAGPLVFGVGAGTGGVEAAVLVACLVGVWGALGLRGRGAAPAEASSARPAAAAPAALRLLFAGALATYASNFLLAASLTYIVSDAYGERAPAAQAGRLMTVVYGSTVLTSLAVAGRKLRVGPGWSLASGAVLVATGLCIGSEVSRSPWAQGAAGVAIGACFALLLLAVREAASEAQGPARDEALARFNNLGNTSALAAFSLMVALVEIGCALHIAFVRVVAAGMVALASVGLVTLGAALARRPRGR